VVGAAAAGAAALAAGLGQSHVGRHRPGTAAFRPDVGRSAGSGSGGASPASPRAADWEALGRQLSGGRLIRPGEHGYGAARLLFDPRFDNIRPAGVAYCLVPHDVSACLDFARRFGTGVAPRSGGHSYGGWSTSTGLVIDVSGMSGLRLDGGSATARIGAGMPLVDLYRRLSAHGLAIPGGSCPTVGVAGLALGGGVGVVGRALGLTCDNVESVQMVTADGSVIECNSGSNGEEFWACRGGGGGNFGVATAFTFRTHALGQIVVFFLEWSWSRAARVVAGWQSWAPFAPDELWSFLHLAAAPGGQAPTVSVGGTYLGSVAGAQDLLGKLYASVGTAPASPFVQQEAYLSAMLVEAGCATLSVPQCHLPSQDPAGRLARQPQLARSDFFTTRLPGPGIAALLAGVERLPGVAGAPGGVGGIALDALGGAINRVSPAATAFVHRDALFLAQYTTDWDNGGAGAATAGAAGAAGLARQAAWLRSFYASMRPYASGQAYQNYADPGLADWQHAYYGANYPRLQQVKAACDPHEVFRFPQSVRLPQASRAAWPA
jgi:FAD/FMN-containing dehydrogenase